LTPEEKAAMNGAPAKTGPVVLRREVEVGNSPFCLGTKPGVCPIQLDLKPKFIWFPTSGLADWTARFGRNTKAKLQAVNESKSLWDSWLPNPACGAQKSCEHKALAKPTSFESFKNKEGKYAGVSATAMIASNPTHSNCDKNGDSCKTTNCQCQSYIQVSGYREFVASELTLSISRDRFNLCASYNPIPVWYNGQPRLGKATKPMYLRVALQTRLGEHEPWSEHKTFFFQNNYRRGETRPDKKHGFWGYANKRKLWFDEFVMPLEEIRARDVRIMLVCTKTPTANAYPIQLFQNGRNERWRTFRVGMKAETTMFNWNKESIHAVMRSIDTSTAALDCDAINGDPVLSKHFANWSTPADGKFVQEPHLGAKPAAIRVFSLFSSSANSTSPDVYLDAFASKRRATVHGYLVEKRLICVQNSTVAPICCVNKYADPKRQRNLTHSEDTLGAVLRNF